MKKSYFWGLLLAIMALIPSQNAFAEYCTMSSTFSNSDRHLDSFTLTDGVEELAVSSVQPNSGSNWWPSYTVYNDHTSKSLTTQPGATLYFKSLSWTGSWMHGYVFIDYNQDETFDASEAVSYNFYSEAGTDTGVNSKGESVSNNCGVTAGSMPSWTLPTDLASGTYRLRLKIDWNSLDACGASDIVANRGCIADITLNVEAAIPERTIDVTVTPEGAGTVTGAGTAMGNITLVATPTPGYEFVNWTLNGEVVSTEMSYTDATEGNKSYVANFAALTAYPEMSYMYTNGMDQANRYLKEVVATAGETVTTVFSATSESELPKIDPNVVGMATTVGAYVDKTATPIIVPQGTTEFTVNFKAWTESMTIGSSSANCQLNWTQQAAFIDWNNNFCFYEEGENYGKSSDTMGNDGGVCQSFISETGYTRTFSVPADVKPGVYRMRVCYFEPDGNNAQQWQNTIFEKGNCTTRNGKTYDFAIEVIGVTPETPVYAVSVSTADEAMGTAEVSATEVEEGTEVTFTATAAEGYQFVNWTSGEEVVSTENPYTVAVTAEMALTANFELIPVTKYAVSVATADEAMGTAEVSATEVEEGEEVTFTATAAEGYQFVNWTSGEEVVSTENPYTVAVTAEMVLTANFELIPVTKYTVTVNAGVGGTAEASATEVEEGQTVTLTATAAEGYAFDNWTSSAVEPVYYIQNYTSKKYLGYNTVNLAAIDEQTSDATIAPSTLNDGEFTIYLTNATYDQQTPPQQQSYLNCGSSGRFSGNCDNTFAAQQIAIFKVEDPAAETITATKVTEVKAGETYLFVGLKNGAYYALTDEIYKENDATGQRMVGAEVTITDGTITYVPGTSSALWTLGNKAVASTENPYTVTVTADVEYTANFVEVPVVKYPVSVTTVDGAMGTAEVSATEVKEGDEVTFTATANLGYKFIGWLANGETVSTENPYTTAVTAEMSLVANFEALTPAIIVTNDTTGVERQFTFDAFVEGAKVQIDWGNGELQEYEIAYYDSWTTWTTTITGTLQGEGVVKIYGDQIRSFDCGYAASYPVKVTSIDVSGCPNLYDLSCYTNSLTTIDLTNNSALSKLALNGNPELSNIVWPETNALTTVDLNDCAFTTLDLSACTSLTTLKVNNNTGMGSIDVSANTALTTLYANNIGLTTIDLSANTKLKNLYVNENQLTSLNISNMVAGSYTFANDNQLTELITAPAMLTSKTRINIKNNNFTLATLPAITGINAYNYAPQNAMTIATEITEGEELDLSSQAMVGENATVYTWYTAEGEEFTGYTVEGGKFVFNVAADTELYCTMTNASFDKFSGSNAFTTTNIVVKYVPVERKVQFKSNDIVMGSVQIISPSQGGTGTGGTGTGGTGTGGTGTSGTGTGSATSGGGQSPWVITTEDVTAQASVQGNAYEFVNWTIGEEIVGTELTYTYTGEEEALIQANFRQKDTYKTITIDVKPVVKDEYGTNIVGSVKFQGRSGKTAIIEQGSSLTAVATAKDGYEFSSWKDASTGEDVSFDAEYTFTVAADINLEAWFSELPVITTCQVLVEVAPTEDYGTVVIEGVEGLLAEVEVGTEVTAVATPAEGKIFEGWFTFEGDELSTNATYTFTATEDVVVVAWFTDAPVVEPEYCTDFGTSTRNGGRSLTSVTLSDGVNGGTISVNQSSSYGAAIYIDKTDVEISLEAGKEITADVNFAGEWMNSYLFVDWNNDAEFTANLNNFIPAEDSELLSFSFWTGENGSPSTNGVSDSNGYNSLGQSVSGDARSNWDLPVFTIPANIAEGTYRARVKIDWNNANPCGITSTSDAPCVVDFMLTITAPDGIEDADADAVQVYAADGVIYINGYEGDVKVVNVAGQVVKDVNVNGNDKLEMAAGLYMVVTGDQVTKVVVK